MPPRKKQRFSPRLPTATSTAEIPGTSPIATPIAASPSDTAHTPAEPISAAADVGPIYWSTAQQTALFKSLIAHKPTGPHKHMNMLSLVQQLQNTLGYYVPTAQVWAKLGELYDMEALDERETAYVFGRMDESGDWAEAVRSDFVLPGEPRRHGISGGKGAEEAGEGVDEEAIREIYGASDAEEAWFVDEVWKRRFAKEEEEEEGEEDDGNRDELDQTTTSPAPSTVASAGRGGRGRRGGRELRRSGRGASSTPMKDEDDGGEEEEEEDGGGEADDGGRATRSTRSATKPVRKGKKK